VIIADAGFGQSIVDALAGSSFLTDMLRGYTDVLNAGAEKIVSAEASVCGALLGVQLLILVMRSGMSFQLREGIFTFIGAYIWYIVASNGVAVAQAWMSYMGSVASQLSSGVPTDVMNDPSKIINLAFKANFLLVAKCLSYSNPFTAIFALLFYSVAGSAIMAGLLGMSVVAMVVGIMSGMNVVVGLMLVPFLIERQTASVGGRGLGMIMDGGISLACTSVAIGVAYGQVTAPLPPDPGFQEASVLGLKAFAAFLVCGGIAWFTKGAGLAMTMGRVFGK
jgi:hypothetical protein